MIRKSYVFGILALTFGVLLFFNRSPGSTVFEDNGQPIAWPTGESIRFLSPTSFPPGSTTETLILEAMALWNIIPEADFEYFYSPLDQDYPVDHFDGFNDTLAVSENDLDPGVLGVTYMVNDGPDWFDMDILFSDFPAGVGYNLEANPSCDVVTQPTPTNGFSFLLEATHELGHGLGLGHDPIGDEPAGTPWFVATMNPRYPSGGPIGQQNIVEVHTDDRNGVRRLYPPSGSGVRAIDLALASYVPGPVLGEAVALPVSPLIVLPGGELTVESLIENFGATNELGVSQGFYLSTDATIDTGDLFLGALTWDILFENALLFGAIIDMPEDVKAGTYYLGSILDDLGIIPEMFEDNNAALYCDAITVAQLAPAFQVVVEQTATCGQSFSGPTPTIDLPLNMGPVTWTLDTAPPGMIIRASTGSVFWPEPTASAFPQAVNIRATNGAGTSTGSFFVQVQPSAPSIEQLADTSATCHTEFLGPHPQLTDPACMEPVLFWSLDQSPLGMSIDSSTGVVSWTPGPLLTTANGFGSHRVTLRAFNIVGSSTTTWQVHLLAGDLTGDGSLDLMDFAQLRLCISGPGAASAQECTCGDADLDGDIDLRDLSHFQDSFTN